MNVIKVPHALAWMLVALSLGGPTSAAEKTRYSLPEAAQKEDVEWVKSLLVEGQDAKDRDLALLAAVAGGHKDAVELLLSHGANVDGARWGNFPPLLFAVAEDGRIDTLQGFTHSPFSGDLNRPTSRTRSRVRAAAFRDIVQLLLDHGADVNAPEKRNGFVPLHYAIFGGDKEMVELLLRRGAQPNPAVPPAPLSHRYVTPLHLAARYGDLPLCGLLVGHGAQVNSPTPRDTALWKGTACQTPLHWAVYSGNAELVEFLIAHGAQVDAADSEDETPLHLAVERADRAVVGILLSYGADANRKGHDGWTPLSIATRNGSAEIAKLLLAHHGQLTIHSAATAGDVDTINRLVKGGIKINRLDDRGQTALHAAVTAGQVQTVEWLITCGANVNLPDDNEVTALSLALEIAQRHNYSSDSEETAQFTAMKNKQRDIIALLIGHGATLDFSYGMAPEKVLSHATKMADLLIVAGRNLGPYRDSKATLLHRAAWWGDRKAVEELLELGADLQAADGQGGTPLHAAMQSGCTGYWDVLTGPHVEVAQLLIEHGANVNAPNNEKVTPLHGAAGHGHTEAMGLLLDKGATVNAADETQETPLHWAAVTSSIKAMELLLARGADPNARDSAGDTPLLLLLSRHSLLRDEAKRPAEDFALRLMKQGVQVNVQNKDGVTPLQEAAALGFPDLVEAMLTRGAPVNLRSTSGWTALHSAVMSGAAKCVEMLLQHGAQVDGMGRLPDTISLPRFSSSARTPLHIAASQGDNRIIQMLIEHGADVNARDSDGRTPLALAQESKHIETVKILSSKGADTGASAVQPWSPGRRDPSPISQAQANRQLDVVESLASKTPAAQLTSLLFQEVDSGHSELIPVLVAHGADVNAHESVRQETPLHRAVNKKNLRAIEVLLAHGADINSKDKNNETPLGAAVYRGQKETVSLLLSHGADVNAAYKEQCEFRRAIPLHVAVQHSYVEVAQMLVLKGANVNAVGLWEGVTPLHLALKDRALLELMLEHGGRIDVRATDGTTLLHGAALAGQEDLARYLITKGAPVNAQDRAGNTPLHLAAKKSHRGLCALLLAHQADAGLRNKKGLLPLDYAQACGIEDVMTQERAQPR